MCDGTGVAAQARNKCAAKEEAIEAVVTALRSHLQVARVQKWGFRALLNIYGCTDDGAQARKQQAVTTGATNTISEALRAHPHNMTVQALGQRLSALLSV